MKITTWNVNGLRAALGKGILAWIKSNDADIICLQEIKTRPEQLIEEYRDRLGDYRVIWNPAQRPGYSGVATLIKSEPSEISIGTNMPHFDAEGRVICTRYPGFILYNIYFPNGQRDQERLDYKLDFYAHLLEICDKLHQEGEQIIICGDFNTAHREIDLKNPKENEKNSGFLPEERAWIDRYQEHGFMDAYRQLYPEQAQYTWWTYRFNARKRNIGWRLDYYLMSQSLLPSVRDVVIHEEVMGSDHCPVDLILN